MEHTQPIAVAERDRQDVVPANVDGVPDRLKTTEEAARWFADRGITISEWALERNFNPSLVYQVLAGTRKAVRGDSFKIAVALGLKSMPADKDSPATNRKRTEVEPAAAN